MSLRTWFAERKAPALKCARIGHDVGMETRTGWVAPEHGWHVMDKVKQERCACHRCGEVMSSWVTVSRSGFNSVSWPSELWDEYEANDYERWTDHGWRSILTKPEPSNV